MMTNFQTMSYYNSFPYLMFNGSAWYLIFSDVFTLSINLAELKKYI